MKTLTHSHAPWYAIDFAGYWTLCDTDAYQSVNLLDQDSCSRAEANAKLAAAAPELLEACMMQIGLLKKDKECFTQAEINSKIHNAVYKAIGDL